MKTSLDFNISAKDIYNGDIVRDTTYCRTGSKISFKAIAKQAVVTALLVTTVVTSLGAKAFAAPNTPETRADAQTEIVHLMNYVSNFSDLSEGHWAYKDTMNLVARGAINGYPDGTFRPEATITYAEFLKVLMAVTGAKVTAYTQQEGEVWYQKYATAAYENGVVINSEIKDWTRPITRKEAALFVARTMVNVLNEDSTVKGQSSQVKDYSTFENTTYEAPILYNFGLGIICGDNNSNFNPNKTLTRAESATILLRVVDASARKFASDKIVVEVDPLATPYEDMVVTEEGIAQGTVRPTYAEPICMKALETARFYKENGKYYASIILPELPEGLLWKPSLDAWAKDGTNMYASITRDYLGKTGTIVFEMTPEQSISNMKHAQLSVAIITPAKYIESCCYGLQTNLSNKAYVEYGLVNIMDSREIDTSNIFNW